MTILAAIVLVLVGLWVVGWLGNILLGIALFFFVAAVDLWDKLFPPPKT